MKNFVNSIALLLFGAIMAFSQNTGMNGKWKMIKSKSSFLDYYREMTLEITINKSYAVIITRMGPKRSLPSQPIERSTM
jgi:hypothetical protein